MRVSEGQVAPDNGRRAQKWAEISIVPQNRLMLDTPFAKADVSILIGL